MACKRLLHPEIVLRFQFAIKINLALHTLLAAAIECLVKAAIPRRGERRDKDVYEVANENP